MLPARKAPCNPSSFFGKNYPRAVGKLDDENQLIKGLDARLPNVPLLREGLLFLIRKLPSESTCILKCAIQCSSQFLEGTHGALCRVRCAYN